MPGQRSIFGGYGLVFLFHGCVICRNVFCRKITNIRIIRNTLQTQPSVRSVTLKAGAHVLVFEESAGRSTRKVLITNRNCTVNFSRAFDELGLDYLKK